MTAPARIRQADLERAMKAAKNSGFASARVRIDPDGTIDIMLGLAPDDSPPANPLDRLLDYVA